MTVAKYWHVFKLVWIERMAYRLNFLLEVASGIIASLIVVFVWLAVYRSSGQKILGGYTDAEMVTYILGAGLINTFISGTAENPETSQSIQDGSLSGLLILPMNPYALWFVRDLALKGFYLVLGMLGYTVVFFAFRKYLVIQFGFGQLFLFAFSLGMAAVLQFMLFEALSLLAFWMENTYGMRFTLRVILEVAGGGIIPLSFFPELVRNLFGALPFSYMIYLPLRIYLGKIGAFEAAREFALGGLWIAGLAALNACIWRCGLRQYVSMGD